MPPGVVAFDLNFDYAAVGQRECRAEKDLAHQFQVGLAVKLAGAEFVGVRADDDSAIASNEATLEFDGLAEVRLAVVGILARKDEGVGWDDVFLRNMDVEGAGDKVGEANAGLDERDDRVEVGSGHSIAGGDDAPEGFHG